MQVITETVKVYPAVRAATSNLHLCMKNRSVAIENQQTVYDYTEYDYTYQVSGGTVVRRRNGTRKP